MRVFYLGISQPHWLGRLPVPVCLSYRSLAGRGTYPIRRGDDVGKPVPWILDSGAFTEVSQNGRWTVPASRYANYVNELWGRNLGLQWAGIQDWMCEPFIVAKTGLSVGEHQTRTIANYEELRSLAPRVTWVPTLQGNSPAAYLAHYEAYLKRGHDLRLSPVVGVGSVCRLQRTSAIVDIFDALAPLGLKLHGYGVKQLGLERIAQHLDSSDSMAWSSAAFNRHTIMLGHVHGALRWRRRLQRMETGNCANCPEYATNYYHEMTRRFVDDGRERAAS